jgi:predicted metal-dependent HD superfamily phosphohydrolase
MNQQERDALQSAWLRLLGGFGVPEVAARAGFDELAAAYDEPGRFYHNLDHLADVLRTVDGLADLAWDPAAVRLAAWFHDAVYDSRALDNEERSSALAKAHCESWGIPRATIDTVRRLILATKMHPFDPEDRDEAVLLDADLAIFGAGQERYNAYARAIRQEYQWVPEEDYRQGRLRILRSFLQRERIYRLDRMQQAYEAAARENLSREMAALGA